MEKEEIIQKAILYGLDINDNLNDATTLFELYKDTIQTSVDYENILDLSFTK